MLLAGTTILLLAATPTASAHPLSTSAVRLDLETHQVTAEVDLPLDELSIARSAKLSAENVLEKSTVLGLRRYVREHMSATDSTGQTWRTRVTGGHVQEVDSLDNLVLHVTLTPSSGSVGDFVLHYDAVMDKLISHRVFISARMGHSGSFTTLAMLSWQTQTVPVAATLPAESHGFLAATKLGIHHISGGSDHLLFLIMLLLPAPLAARGTRWVRRPDLGPAAWQVIHVVTAFAVGHSITLVLGALGWVHLPTRLVESGIALSVLVSAVHAIRPLVRRGEILIAGSFGLLHGLAFAALLTQLDLSRGGLVATLLGFNLGIELTQLLVVALVMPSLIVLSRTPSYAVLRPASAALGAVLAAGWLAQRSGAIPSNPLEPLGDLLVAHPIVLAAGLASLALASVLAQHARRAPVPQQPETPGPGNAQARTALGVNSMAP
jgi:HupE / UreJ protein